MEYYSSNNYHANSGCPYNYHANSGCPYQKSAKRLPECTCKKLTACKGTCLA